MCKGFKGTNQISLNGHFVRNIKMRMLQGSGFSSPSSFTHLIFHDMFHLGKLTFFFMVICLEHTHFEKGFYFNNKLW